MNITMSSGRFDIGNLDSYEEAKKCSVAMIIDNTLFDKLTAGIKVKLSYIVAVFMVMPNADILIYNGGYSVFIINKNHQSLFW